MDSQKAKILLSIQVCTDCILSCFVNCTPLLTQSYENEEIVIVDLNGVKHKAIINFCPENVKTIDILDFMNIFVKISKI